MSRIDPATEHAKCRSIFEASLQSELYLTWYQEACKAFDSYEGRGLTPEDLEVMRDRKIRPFQHNLIAPRINSVAGKAIQARTSIKYTSRSGKEEEVDTASALTGLAMFVQDKNKSMRIIGEAGVSAMICGIGYHTFDVDDGRIVEAKESPLDFVWDVRDRTPYLQNQGFIAQMIWKSREEWKMLFPDKEDEIDSVITTGAPIRGGTTYSLLGERLRLLSLGNYYDSGFDELCLVKMEYRVPAKYWVYVHKNGAVYTTFNKAEAEKNSMKGDTPAEQKGYKVYICWFAGDVLIDVFENPYQMNPSRGDFLTTPIVAFREELSGLPYGIVRAAIDPQNLYNRLLSLAYHKQTHNRVIMEEGAVTDMRKLAKEMARADGIIQYKQGKRLDFDSNLREVAQIGAMMQAADVDVQKSLGIYDEMMGVETNAKSGIAIQRRQAASQTTIALMFDRFLDAKYRWADKLLWLVRAVFDDNKTIYVLDDESATKSVNLNEPVTDENGKQVIRQDIRVGTYDIVIEETMDVGSVEEETSMKLMELIQAGLGPERWSDGILDIAKVDRRSKLRKEVMQGLHQQLAAKAEAGKKLQGGLPQGGITEGQAGALPATITETGSV